jgi:hypothetical protein
MTSEPPDEANGMNDTAEMVLFSVPDIPASALVGGVMRPPRVLAAGRRRSDRWLVRLVGVLLAFACGFVLYAGYRVADINRDLARLTEQVHTSCRSTP